MLQLHGLSRRYGETVALDDLSLEVPEGELLGFVGPNGAGKTTAQAARGLERLAPGTVGGRRPCRAASWIGP
jgi:ABC-type branched-subunit amino acid transport system ATPase component